MPAYCYGFNVYKQANVNMSLDLDSTIEGCKEWSRFSTATLTYIHARIQEIFERFGGGGGGEGVQARLTEKSSDVVFFLPFFVSPQLVQWSWLFQRKLLLNYNFTIFHGEGRSNISNRTNFSQGEGVQ